MGRTVLTVVQGRPLKGTQRTGYRDNMLTGLPVLVSLVIVLMLGVHIPAPLKGCSMMPRDFLEQSSDRRRRSHHDQRLDRFATLINGRAIERRQRAGTGV